jgi:gas vesicle protein
MCTARFLGGLLVGGALGAIVGMLIAPRSGEETREMIQDEFSDRLDRSIDNVKSRADELKSKAQNQAEMLREKSQLIAAELEEAGRETWDKVKTTVKSSKVQHQESPN